MALGFGECLSMKAECATFWAGWGVIATAAVGGVTVLVAFLAWLTSRRAAKIAEQATRIAEQQHAEFVSTREANGQVVGRILVHEVSELPVELHTLILTCERIIARGVPQNEDEVDFLERLLSKCSKSLLPGTEQSEERLHTLPDEIRNELAFLIGYSRSLNSMSADLASLIRVETYGGKGLVGEKVFNGDLKVIEMLKEYLERFSRYSLHVVNRLRTHVGAEPRDLSKFDVDNAFR